MEAPTLPEVGEILAVVSWKVVETMVSRGDREYQLCSVQWAVKFWIMSDCRATLETMMEQLVTADINEAHLFGEAVCKIFIDLSRKEWEEGVVGELLFSL